MTNAKDTSYLTFLQSTTIAATSGNATIANASKVFTGFLDSDFQIWGTNKSGEDTEPTETHIYEMLKDGTFADLFGSVCSDLDLLCLTQGQIIEFARNNRDLLRQDGYGTFFLFKVDAQLVVADVFVSGDELKASVVHFSDKCVWRTSLRYRLVVPQQKLVS